VIVVLSVPTQERINSESSSVGQKCLHDITVDNHCKLIDAGVTKSSFMWLALAA
jgi:hypothetical protein